MSIMTKLVLVNDERHLKVPSEIIHCTSNLLKSIVGKF